MTGIKCYILRSGSWAIGIALRVMCYAHFPFHILTWFLSFDQRRNGVSSEVTLSMPHIRSDCDRLADILELHLQCGDDLSPNTGDGKI